MVPKKRICDRCGIPKPELQIWENAWNAPKFCQSYHYENQLCQTDFYMYIDKEDVEREYQSQLLT
jgi:hypothetical protein